MYPPPRCPWQGNGQNRPGNFQGNQYMFRNGPPPFGQPPGPPMPYFNNMMHPPFGPGMMWQGPGPSRPRGRGHRHFRGNNNQWNNNRPNSIRNNQEEGIKDACCKCGERLQNSNEPGIHLCDGGNEVQIGQVVAETDDDAIVNVEVEEEAEEDIDARLGKLGNKVQIGQVMAETDDDAIVNVEVEEEGEEDIDARLEKLLSNLKDCLREKYNSVTEALEGYVSEKIDEITTLHRENADQKETLEKLKKELEEKAEVLLKQETELREKQRKLTKERDTFKRDMKREKEEVCRQWQELRDEITRMEEVHKSQKGRVRLDVGGNVFTTSFLTLTRESDSMLAAMFSGRHEIRKEEDGSVFIDRDGTHFRYVLNYLRDGGMSIDSLPKDRQLLKELRKEATYYQLHGLLQQIEKCLY